MARVRIATYNCENLFARFKFRSNTNAESAVRDGWTTNNTKFDLYDDDSKEITGSQINELDADVLCLQEVEGLDTLKRFRSLYLGGRSAYPFAAVIDGNDPRRIDVAVLSRRPIIHIRTWQHLRQGRSYVFSRDCLEFDIDTPDGRGLTVYNNHFKSMMGGRSATKEKRVRQSKAVRNIVRDRFGQNRTGQPPENRFVILGDFNDYRGTGSGITALTNWGEVQDVVRRLPNDEEWTHYYARERKTSQLDYLMLSDSLARAHDGVRPQIWRAGLPWRASAYDGPRFEGVGQNKPKASDHCPVTFDLDL